MDEAEEDGELEELERHVTDRATHSYRRSPKGAETDINALVTLEVLKELGRNRRRSDSSDDPDGEEEPAMLWWW